MDTSSWIFWAVLVTALVGLIGNLLPGFPGITLIWLAILVYAVVENFTAIDTVSFLLITFLAILGLTSDFWLGQLGAKAAGASWRAMFAGIGGAIVGAVVGSVCPGSGIMLGLIVGAVLGTFIYERLHTSGAEALRASAGILAGCLVSYVVQICLGLAMIVLFVWKVVSAATASGTRP